MNENITINGISHPLPTGQTNIASLLQYFEFRLDTIVVEHNSVIVTREAFATTPVQKNDVLEVVNFMGGG